MGSSTWDEAAIDYALYTVLRLRVWSLSQRVKRASVHTPRALSVALLRSWTLLGHASHTRHVSRSWRTTDGGICGHHHVLGSAVLHVREREAVERNGTLGPPPPTMTRMWASVLFACADLEDSAETIDIVTTKESKSRGCMYACIRIKRDRAGLYTAGYS